MSFTTRRLISKAYSQYKIPNSLRFRSSASAYLSRTPSVASNRTTWTWSGWVKRGSLGTSQDLLCARDNNNITNSYPFTILAFNSSDQLDFAESYNNVYIGRKTTTQVFRDSSAWMHILVNLNTTLADANDRMQIYINGSRVTSFSTSINPSGYSSMINYNVAHMIGANMSQAPYSVNAFFDGYLTEINFIDGQALTPLSFGRIDPNTGVWVPSRYNGTYGTNGFYLKFTDNSAATAAAIGKDFSGNNNNWTPTNISLTAGSTYDSMIDTPTPYDDGGYGRGNYCTLNPLFVDTTNPSYPPFTLSSGNLAFATNTTSGMGMPANITHTSTRITGSLKYYFEAILSTIDISNTGLMHIALGAENTSAANRIGIAATYGAASPSGYNYYYYVTTNGSTTYTSVPTITQGSILMFAIDNDSGKVYLGRNGTWYNSGNPSAGTGNVGIISNRNEIKEVSINLFGRNGDSNIQTGHLNFGQRPFAYTPPTGFKTLCTQNLTAPAIVNPAQYMAATTYAGTGATQTIANTVNNKSFQPDLVWIKGRSAATDHALYDSVRGVTKDLVSNSAAAETTQATGLTTFGSNGFTIGNLAKLNTNAQTYVAWQWKAGDSTVTNTAGTITSQVDANPTAGFSIVTYTGTGANATVGHGLNLAPKMIILKSRNSIVNWLIYHAFLGSGSPQNYAMQFDSASQYGPSSTYWNGSNPTSSVFNIGTIGGINSNGANVVAYCFAEVEGFSKFGSYVGNGSANGPFVYCGFRPKWVMYKSITEPVGNWQMFDTSRDLKNTIDLNLAANISGAEFSSPPYIDIVSNGFKLRTSSTAHNISGGTYIFAAFAEAPFKYALAR